MAPNATVKFAPMVAPEGLQRWRNERICQEAFREITRLIEQRDHVQFDSYLPYRNRWMDASRVHLYDNESVKFFTEIFKQI